MERNLGNSRYPKMAYGSEYKNLSVLQALQASRKLAEAKASTHSHLADFPLPKAESSSFPLFTNEIKFTKSLLNKAGGSTNAVYGTSTT